MLPKNKREGAENPERKLASYKSIENVFLWRKQEEESDDEFCDRTTAPVPKWGVLARNRAVWVVGAALPATTARGDGTGASRPGAAVTAVTPRLARTPAETPGRPARVGLLGLQCSAGALLRGSFELINK